MEQITSDDIVGGVKVKENPIDLQNALQNCGGRLTIKDAELLLATSRDSKVIVEIGSMDGCSTQILGTVAKENDGHLYCIEPAPKQKWRWNVERHNLQNYVTLLFGASPWVPVEKVMVPIDYLFIDGDHRTRWALADYHFWERFVRKGGRIAFHDWSGGKEVGAWVRRAIEIILETDNLLEIGRAEGGGRGLIVFEKTWESPKCPAG